MLARAAEVGAAAAAREFGIPASTVRNWRARQAGAVDEVGEQLTPAQTWDAAREALKKVRELLDASDTLGAQRSALTLAVLLDKSMLLEDRAAIAAEREVGLAERHGEQIARLIREFFRCLGLPMTASVRRLLRELLTQSAASADTAEQARSELGLPPAA